MASNYIEWYFQLNNRRTGRPISDSTGLYVVLTASTPARATLYSDANGTSLTQPATMKNGIGRFWTDASVASVDISVLTAAGQAYFIEGMTLSQHQVPVDPEKEEYQFICDWNGNTVCNLAAATGFNLLAGMKIKDVNIHVTTNTTATGMHFGVSGTPSGFGALVKTSVTGYQTLDVVIISNETATFSIVAATQKRGSLIVDYGTGFSATVTAGGSKGYFAKKPYMVTAATGLVYTVMETNSGATGSGYIYLDYEIMPTQGN